MSIILSVHSVKAFQEFLLPPINNAEESIFLDGDVFSVRKDVELLLEVIDKRWRFRESDD